jgi:hypothetical protein
MEKARFKCKRCSEKFEIEIFERGEVEATNRPSKPVCCPICYGVVERV